MERRERGRCHLYLPGQETPALPELVNYLEGIGVGGVAIDQARRAHLDLGQAKAGPLEDLAADPDREPVAAELQSFLELQVGQGREARISELGPEQSVVEDHGLVLGLPAGGETRPWENDDHG